MIRLHCIVEGKTEKNFVENVLKSYFYDQNINILPQIIITSWRKGIKYRGGGLKYNRVKKEISNLLKDDPKAYLTTMIDFYALSKDFPGWATAQKMPDIYQKVDCLEDAFKQDIEKSFRKNDTCKFIPYIQLHEFEALLFTNPKKISECMSLYNQSVSIDQLLKDIVEKFKTPEHINQDNSPSKRLKQIDPQYDKVFAGPLIAEEIGIEHIKSKCEHFKKWIEQIEQIK